LEITKKTVLSLMLVVVITILITPTLTTTITAAYAGGYDNNDDNGDGNKQKAEDDSAAAIADCDENEVERAGFDCIAIATNDVEIEPPEQESATLTVCKETTIENTSPSSFTFTVEGNNPSPEEFVGDDSDGCVDVTIGPGEYSVTEAAPGDLAPGVQIEDGCEQDPLNPQRATGEIEAGETQERCIFLNSPGAS
jgi:hypothetical protein